MDCVIVTLDNDNKHGFFGRKIEYKSLYYDNHNGGADVIVLPYSADEMEHTKDKKLIRILKKAYPELKGKYVCCYENDRLKNTIDLFGVRYCDGSRVFIDLIDVIVKKVAKNIGVNLNNERIGIYDYNFSNVCADIVMKLAECCADISVYTANLKRAKIIAEEICDITGMPVLTENDYDEWKEDKKLIILLGEFMHEYVPENVQVIDIYGKFPLKNRIRNIEFEISGDFQDIINLTGVSKNQDLVEFILQTGAELKLGEDIKVIGYK